MSVEQNSDFESELDAILNQGEEKDSTLPAENVQTQPAQVEKLKAGGREFNGPSDLAKAYEALQKDYTKKSQSLGEYEKYKQFVEWGKQTSKHTDLHKELDEVVQRWNQRIAGGMNQQKAGQLANSEVMELRKTVETLVNREAQRELQSEIQTLKNKYNVDTDVVREVLEKASEFVQKGHDLPLEDVYRIIAFDKRAAAERANGEKAGMDKLRNKQAANVGGSSAASVAPAAKSVSEMSGDEFDNALEEALRGTGTGVR